MDYQTQLAKALTAWKAGELELAWQLSEALIQMAPQDPHLLHLRGVLLSQSEYQSEAVALLEKAAALGPPYWPELYLTLGIVLEGQNQLFRAENWLLKTLSSPVASKAHYVLGKLYARLGRTPDAQAHFEKAAQLNPQADLEKACLFNLVATPRVSNLTRRQRFQTYAATYLDPLRHYQTHTNLPDPKRPLRIGLISGDFHQHVAATNFHSLFEYRDPGQFQFYAYAHQSKSDAWTDFFRQSADRWLEIQNLSDEAVATQIYQDQIDILIDCSGFSKGNRLEVLARKPAPIQISAFGFLYTTGMDAIDYQFTDALAVPETSAHWYSEDLIYLTTQLHWKPWIDPDGLIAPTPSPFKANGWVTFGCGNAPYKINEEVIKLWAEILNQLPMGRLLLKYTDFELEDIQSHYYQVFAKYGVAANRLDFFGKTSQKEHLEFYQKLDIALDPFPYTGGVTTCETLYMGVPVISLAGECTTVSLGILRQLELEDLIANHSTDYLEKAVSLANSPKDLTTYHQTLRQNLLNSPICDGINFTREVETACREIWRYWCESH